MSKTRLLFSVAVSAALVSALLLLRFASEKSAGLERAERRGDASRMDERVSAGDRDRRVVYWGGSSSAEAEVEPSAVEGRVIDAVTRQPVPYAWISLRHASGEVLDETGSDGKGRFAFGAAPGGSTVAAEAPGYAVASLSLLRDRSERRQGEERSAVAVVLELEGAVRLRGMVEDAGGKPIPGAEVWAEDEEATWRSPRPVSSTVPTDAEGRFAIDDAPPGKIAVHARAPGRAPGKVDVGSLGPGRERDGVRIELRDGGILDGVVLDARRLPVAGAKVAVLPVPIPDRVWTFIDSHEGSRPDRVVTDANGEFRLDSIEGGQVYVAALEGSRMGAVELELVEGYTTTTEILIEAGGTVAGTVITGSGSPVAGATVQAFGGSGVPAPTILAIMAARGGGQKNPSTRTGEDGSFALEGIYDVSEAGMTRRPASKRCSPAAALMTGRPKRAVGPQAFLVVSGPDGSAEVWCEVGARDAVIRIGANLVRGTVEGPPGGSFDGKATVTASPFWRTIEADPDFQVALEPGSYALSAWAPGFGESEKVIVDVEEGRELPFVRLVLGAGGTLRGTLIGEDGHPVPGARVSVRRSSGYTPPGTEGAVHSGPDGTFELSAGPGEDTVFVYHPEYEPEIVRTTAMKNASRDLGVIRLRPGDGSSRLDRARP